MKQDNEPSALGAMIGAIVANALIFGLAVLIPY